MPPRVRVCEVRVLISARLRRAGRRGARLGTILGLAACSWGTGPEAEWRELELEVVRVYGDTRALPPGLDLRGTQWVGLGMPMDIAVGGDGTVFVVDRAWRQIVGFNPDGSLRSIIRPTQGMGPGEFQVPNNLALNHRGEVAVLDAAGNRVQVFSPDGDLLNYLPLTVGATIYGVMIDTEEEFWILPVMAAERRSAALRLDPGAVRVDEVFPSTARDRDYGGSGGLALAADGAVLLAHRQPGTWTEWHPEHGYRRYGTEVFPGVQQLPFSDGQPASRTFRPTWTLGIGRAWDGRTLVPFTAYSSFVADGEIAGSVGAIPDMRHFVAVYDPNGAPIGIAELPRNIPQLGEVQWGTRNAHVSRHTGHLYSVAFAGAEVVIVQLRVVL